ncbi:MAG TPA: DUF3822 family protein [Parafilimonas sp.]
MLQKTYSIYSDDLNDARLFIEAGKNHIACWCKKPGENILRAFEFFQCDDYTAENFESLIDSTRLYSRLLTMPVESTNFFWNTTDVLCVPKEKNEPEFLKANFDLMLGNLLEAKIFSAPTNDCLVTWRIDDRQQYFAQQSFRGAFFNNHYVPLLASLKHLNCNAVYLFFYPHYFTVIAFKEDKLQFIQTVKYVVPEDVLYFVLNVCKQYALEKNTPVFYGGFVAEKSKLYDALYQYLEELQLMKVDESLFASEGFNAYPLHYFLPYINYVV